MAPETPTSKGLAHRLLGRVPVGEHGTDSGATAAHAACEALYNELSRWVGTVGCHALFTRALFEKRVGHPPLAGIHVRPDARPHLVGVAEATQAAGAAATAAALEGLLVELIELLSRFIGGDMVANLVDRSIPDGAQGQSGPEPEEEPR